MKIGQGVFLELDYADGGRHNKPRPFLIIDITDEKIFMLNISSIKGKHHKLGFPSNKKIDRYRPPFKEPSFVKLDGLYIVPNTTIMSIFLVLDGRKIHPEELNNIKENFEKYRDDNSDKFHEAETELTDILEMNKDIIQKKILPKEIEEEINLMKTVI